jgi:hypothetical protein
VNRWPELIEQRAARVVLRALQSDPATCFFRRELRNPALL